jgi:class 3 adenylate cyclase
MAEKADAASPVTVLFADISGSTKLYAVRGNESAFTLMSSCLELLEDRTRAAGGRVIKRIGDAVLAVFEAPVAAMNAAAEMQSGFDAADSMLRAEGLHVRVGIAVGAAVLDAGDVYGDVVNVAARLVSLAGADEIFLSGDTYDALPLEMRDSVRTIDQLALKGRPDWVRVYEYLWKRDDLTVSARDRTQRRSRAEMELIYGPHGYLLDVNRPQLTIGREPDNDIAIAHDLVSRHHAQIVMRGDRYILIDRSTNGTYVIIDGGDTYRISRDEMALSGSGRIVPGRKTLQPIRYRVRSG